MSRDDDNTPPSAHRSGEWPAWAGLLHEQGGRIEKDVKALRTEFSKHTGDDRVIEERVNSLLKRQEQSDTETRQMGIGTKLAIIAAIASPLAVIAVESFKH